MSESGPRKSQMVEWGISGILRTNAKAAGVEELILGNRQIAIRRRRVPSSKKVEMFVRDG
jgi:hypothetical protein